MAQVFAREPSRVLWRPDPAPEISWSVLRVAGHVAEAALCGAALATS